jgi:hypothetical protein
LKLTKTEKDVTVLLTFNQVILDSVLELELVALEEGLIWYQILISGSETGLPSVPFDRPSKCGSSGGKQLCCTSSRLSLSERLYKYLNPS